ncbi:MAG: hypothetical protein IKJ55_07935, partial [Clostridia bacterium]|nr:hypothetical protein [Clostridia bacterium]
ILKVVDQMEQMIIAEKANVEATIPLVQQDSRLGWEPRMEYSTDERHLRWKLKHCDFVLNLEIPNLRKSLEV